MTSVLHLERPAFWTEASDPESWFRALDLLVSVVDGRELRGTPRTVAERRLVGVLAWRGAIGLFGAYSRGGRVRLPGVGLLARDAEDRWAVTDEARALLRAWKQSPSLGLEHLASHLVRESPWLRLVLLRLQRRDWELVDWSTVRSGRAGLKAGRSLALHTHISAVEWFTGVETQTSARWLTRTRCDAIAYAPEVLARRSGKDDLSLTPLTAPLLLLESVGWLSRTGALQLPNEPLADLTGVSTPAQALTRLTLGHADLRGFVAAEPVLRELLTTFGATPDDEAFARWMDALIERAVKRGALEVLAAEPGQARHGRGLGADPTRKRVRWVVHPEFNEVFQSAWGALEANAELRR